MLCGRVGEQGGGVLRPASMRPMCGEGGRRVCTGTARCINGLAPPGMHCGHTARGGQVVRALMVCRRVAGKQGGGVLRSASFPRAETSAIASCQHVKAEAVMHQ